MRGARVWGFGDHMTDERIAAPGTPRFNIGRVLAVALGISLRNIFPFMVIAVLISLPGFAFSYWYQTQPRDPQQALHAMATPGFWFGMLLSVACQATMQAALTYGTLQALRGDSVLISACLRRGLLLAPKVAVAGILWYLMIIVSLALVIVPGLIVATMLWVFVPAIVVENAGIIRCFGRSRALTKGRRWQIFGLFLLIMALFIGLEVFLTTKVDPLNLVAVMQDPLVVIGLTAFSLLLTAYAAVMTAVGYYYLRAEKEGIAIDDIAEVFG